MDTPQSLEFCPRLEKFRLFRPADGKTIRVSCKSYKCEYCRPKKLNRFRFFAEQRLKSFDRIRLMTLTARNDFGKFKPSEDTKYHAIKEFAEIFRRFITNLRRSPKLSQYYRDVQYIKVLEFTKAGYPHYHILVDRFLPYLTIQELWNDAVNTVKGTTGINARINIKSGFNANGAGRYITKYLTKTAERTATDIRRFRLWSKSGRLPLFPQPIKTKEWLFIGQSELLNLLTFRLTSLDFTVNSTIGANNCLIDIDTGEVTYCR